MQKQKLVDLVTGQLVLKHKKTRKNATDIATLAVDILVDLGVTSLDPDAPTGAPTGAPTAAPVPQAA